MFSLAPAARMLGWLASTARAGSFCLFWEKILSLLPTLTSVSELNAHPGPAVTPATSKPRNPTRARRRPLRIAPPLGSRPAGPQCVLAHIRPALSLRPTTEHDLGHALGRRSGPGRPCTAGRSGTPGARPGP